jgi:hypothetical protein
VPDCLIRGSVERADAAQNTRAARSRGGTIGLQGRRRQLELAREAEVERQGEAAKLVAGIGRELDALERPTTALVALDVEHVELADQVAEDDRAVDPTVARLD